MFRALRFAGDIVMCWFIAGFAYVWIVYLIDLYIFAVILLPLSLCLWLAWKVQGFYTKGKKLWKR
jgi:hypothetical protein